MTQLERKQFNEAWFEAENIITVIDPQFVPEQQFKRPENCGPKEIVFLLQFLRLQVRMMLHDKESTERENQSLVNLVERGQGVERNS